MLNYKVINIENNIQLLKLEVSETINDIKLVVLY